LPPAAPVDRGRPRDLQRVYQRKRLSVTHHVRAHGSF
jgi:hypothetical protein